MPNAKISELPAAAALDGTEQLALVQGGVTVEATAQDIADLGGGGGGGALRIITADFTADAVSPYITLVIPGGSITGAGLLEIESFFDISGTPTTPPDLLISFGNAQAHCPIPMTGPSGFIEGRVRILMRVQNLNNESSQMFDVQAYWANSESSGTGSKGVVEGQNTGGFNGLRSINTANDQNYTVTNWSGAPSATFTHRSTVARVISDGGPA